MTGADVVDRMDGDHDDVDVCVDDDSSAIVSPREQIRVSLQVGILIW